MGLRRDNFSPFSRAVDCSPVEAKKAGYGSAPKSSCSLPLTVTFEGQALLCTPFQELVSQATRKLVSWPGCATSGQFCCKSDQPNLTATAPETVKIILGKGGEKIRIPGHIWPCHQCSEGSGLQGGLWEGKGAVSAP